MDLDLGCVSSFMVLIEERHFGRAAVRLHMTSSALTKRIQRLEHQVGAVMIERGSMGLVSVTAGGLRFAQQAGPLLDQARAAKESAKTVVDVARSARPSRSKDMTGT